MKILNKRLLATSVLLTTSSPVLAHIGEHPASLYESTIHFLSNPVHMGFVIAGVMIVATLNVVWVKVHANKS